MRASMFLAMPPIWYKATLRLSMKNSGLTPSQSIVQILAMFNKTYISGWFAQINPNTVSELQTIPAKKLNLNAPLFTLTQIVMYARIRVTGPLITRGVANMAISLTTIQGNVK